MRGTCTTLPARKTTQTLRTARPAPPMIRNTLAAIALACTATLAHGTFDACLEFFPGRTPPRIADRSPRDTRELCFDAFAVLHSGQSRTPVYAVERINRARLRAADDEARTDRFYEEARLPQRERARLDDYRGSGYDRGHMAPAADMPSARAMAQSFSLANMVPQAPRNNRGPWARRVEKATRQYALRAKGDIYVFTGPVFANKPVRTIGQQRVWVPSHLYKLVYDPATNRAWAHWIENRDNASATRPIPYAELVRRVGIEFLPGVRPRG